MWTAIVIIVVAGCVVEAIKARHKDRASGASEEQLKTLQALEAKIDKLDADLRDRVETLERIVTDSKSDLRREFEYLEKAS
jgi:phage shock protein B